MTATFDDHRIVLHILAVDGFEETDTFFAAKEIAKLVLSGVNSSDVLTRIVTADRPGNSSHFVQRAILSVTKQLGFQSEKRGLFDNYMVSALRPDHYRRLHNTGILFEVERGKTLQNNMDLLDLWKCHICDEASILFLFVPQLLRQDETERGSSVFATVVKRLGTFFIPPNETNVDAAFIFGY